MFKQGDATRSYETPGGGDDEDLGNASTIEQSNTSIDENECLSTNNESASVVAAPSN